MHQSKAGLICKEIRAQQKHNNIRLMEVCRECHHPISSGLEMQLRPAGEVPSLLEWEEVSFPLGKQGGVSWCSHTKERNLLRTRLMLHQFSSSPS